MVGFADSDINRPMQVHGYRLVSQRAEQGNANDT